MFLEEREWLGYEGAEGMEKEKRRRRKGKEITHSLISRESKGKTRSG